MVTNATATAVRQDGAEIVTNAIVSGHEQQYRTERLLVATGRRPNTDKIGLDRTGVEMNERGEVLVDTYLRTNVPYIYAAGDVIGGSTIARWRRLWAAAKTAWRHRMPYQSERGRLSITGSSRE